MRDRSIAAWLHGMSATHLPSDARLRLPLATTNIGVPRWALDAVVIHKGAIMVIQRLLLGSCFTI